MNTIRYTTIIALVICSLLVLSGCDSPLAMSSTSPKPGVESTPLITVQSTVPAAEFEAMKRRVEIAESSLGGIKTERDVYIHKFESTEGALNRANNQITSLTVENRKLTVENRDLDEAVNGWIPSWRHALVTASIGLNAALMLCGILFGAGYRLNRITTFSAMMTRLKIRIINGWNELTQPRTATAQTANSPRQPAPFI